MSKLCGICRLLPHPHFFECFPWCAGYLEYLFGETKCYTLMEPASLSNQTRCACNHQGLCCLISFDPLALFLYDMLSQGPLRWVGGSVPRMSRRVTSACSFDPNRSTIKQGGISTTSFSERICCGDTIYTSSSH